MTTIRERILQFYQHFNGQMRFPMTVKLKKSVVKRQEKKSVNIWEK